MSVSPAPYNLLPLADGISESVFQTRITDVATYLDVRWHHETDSRRTRKGWLDLYLLGDAGSAVVELKTDDTHKSRLTPEQATWAGRFIACRQRQIVAVWRPRDWAFIHTALHRLAGRPVPHISDLDGHTRYRLRWLPNRDPHGRGGGCTGDFSTRLDADTVRKATPDPTHLEVVACDALGRPHQEQP